MCQSPAHGLRRAHPRSRVQSRAESSSCSEVGSKTESSRHAKAKSKNKNSPLPKPHPAQSSRVLKPLPGPKARPLYGSMVPPAEELHGFAFDITVLSLSPRPPPCDHQSERSAALAGAGREDPPAGQSAVRPRGGGAAAAARRGRGRGGSSLSGSGGAGAGRGGGLAGGGAGRCGTVRTRRPWAWAGGRVAQGRWGELGLPSLTGPQWNLSRPRPEAGGPPEKVHARALRPS